jgi:hypothetical protein
MHTIRRSNHHSQPLFLGEQVVIRDFSNPLLELERDAQSPHPSPVRNDAAFTLRHFN